MGCIIKLLAIVLLLGLGLAATGNVRGAETDLGLGALDWRSAATATAAGADALLSAVGEGTARALGWGWDRLASIPWGAAASVVGHLAGAVAGFAGDAARATGDIAGAARDRVARLAFALSRTESGEPLGSSRLTVWAIGWLLVALLVAWVVLRRLTHWGLGVWRCATARRPARRRGRSPAKT